MKELFSLLDFNKVKIIHNFSTWCREVKERKEVYVMKEYNAKEKFEKVINQLEDLKCHCQDMTRTVEIGEENVWEEDIKALDFAIAALKISSHNL
jgi:putative IMPACT (imprinted ancient) family translation regulator